MKSYNEVAAEVFRRRDEYKAAKRKRKKALKQAAACTACLCAVIAAAIGFGDFGRISNETPTETSSESSVQISADRIVINTNAPEGSSDAVISDFNLDADDFVPMTKYELRAFYGTEIFPEVPDDMAEYMSHTPYGKYGIYRADGGTGDIYHDNVLIIYTNREEIRTLDIEVTKRGRFWSVNACGGTPHVNFGDTAASIVNGTPVYIYQRQSGDYACGFIYNDTGFSICARGFSENELISVIRSLVECGDKYKGNEAQIDPQLLFISDFDGEAIPAKIAPENGEIYISPSLSAAIERYDETARYNVKIIILENRKTLDPSSEKVRSEIQRLSDLGYVTVFGEQHAGKDEYIYYFACHAELEQLLEFAANDNYGYIIKLYDE